jgi:tetratricopeptide (TPR) repeat protein
VGLPLALSIAAARATAHPGYPLTTLVTELRDTPGRGRLEALAGGDTLADVRATISWSYRRLSESAARLFRLLGIHPGPDVTVAAAASLGGGTPSATRRALAELTAGGLVTEHAPGRFACHDLLRVYAAEQSHNCDSGTSRRAATGRLLDHYLHTANAAMLLIQAASEPLPLPPALPSVRPQDLRTISQAIAWFSAEHEVLLSLAAEAAQVGFDSHAWLLPATMASYLHRIGRWHDWAASQRSALAAAVRLGDQHAQARVHLRLGQALTQLGHDEDARASLERALGAFGSLGDQPGQAYAHCAIAHLMEERQHRPRESLNHARRAQRLFHATGRRLGEALALNLMGWDHLELGQDQQALRCCQRAMQLCRDAGDQTLMANIWGSLGLARLRLGQPAEAIGCYQQAIDVYRQGSNREGEGWCLAALGDAQYTLGDLTAAASFWRQALEILSDLHHLAADSVRAKLEPVG